MSPRDIGSLAFKIAGIFAIVQALLLVPNLLSIPAYGPYSDDGFGRYVTMLVLAYVIPILLLIGFGAFLIGSSRELAETTVLDKASALRLRAHEVHTILFSVVGAFLIGYGAIEIPSVIRDVVAATSGIGRTDPDLTPGHWAWAAGTVLQLTIGFGLLFQARRLAVIFNPSNQIAGTDSGLPRCPSCDHPYDPEDYRQDARIRLCSNCEGELPAKDEDGGRLTHD